MSKHNVPDTEFRDQLKKQVGFIQRSCQAFDESHEDEAFRLAVCIRVLVYDTQQSTSLLELLKIKGKIEYWDSAGKYNPNNLIAHLGLTCMSMSVDAGSIKKMVYQPAFSGPSRGRGEWQSFQWWWNKQPVIVDSKKQTFTRKSLILAAANKDGGAHVDHQLDQFYAELTRFNSAGWVRFKGEDVTPFENGVVGASIRQIAFEVLKTLEPHFQDIIQVKN